MVQKNKFPIKIVISTNHFHSINFDRKWFLSRCFVCMCNLEGTLFAVSRATHLLDTDRYTMPCEHSKYNFDCIFFISFKDLLEFLIFHFTFWVSTCTIVLYEFVYSHLVLNIWIVSFVILYFKSVHVHGSESVFEIRFLNNFRGLVPQLAQLHTHTSYNRVKHIHFDTLSKVLENPLIELSVGHHNAFDVIFHSHECSRYLSTLYFC